MSRLYAILIYSSATGATSNHLSLHHVSSVDGTGPKDGNQLDAILFEEEQTLEGDEELDLTCFFIYKERKKATSNFKSKIGNGGNGQSVRVKKQVRFGFSSLSRDLFFLKQYGVQMIAVISVDSINPAYTRKFRWRSSRTRYQINGWGSCPTRW